MTEYGSGGFFTEAALEKTLLQNYGTGSDEGMPENLRFVRGVAALATKHRRLIPDGLATKHPIIFVLHPGAPQEGCGNRVRKNVPMVDNGLTPLVDRIWFSNFTVTEAEYLEVLPDDDEAVLFDLLRSTLDLGALPAVVVETRGGLFELRYFPQGLSAPEFRTTTDLSSVSITPNDVHSVISDIYMKELVSPSSQTPNTSTWKDASKAWANRDAEARIQRVIKVGLGQRYLGCIIRQEQTQVSGRLDLEIEEPHTSDESTVTRHMILELKVLREYGDKGSSYSQGQIDEIVAEGLSQAHSYRKERNARASALCCFDMRKQFRGDSVFAAVDTDAKNWDVRLWLWHLFKSDLDYRKHYVVGKKPIYAVAGVL